MVNVEKGKFFVQKCATLLKWEASSRLDQVFVEERSGHWILFNKGFTWGREDILIEYLENPKKCISGTKMVILDTKKKVDQKW